MRLTFKSVLLIGLICTHAACASAPTDRRAQSPNFRDGKFHNPRASSTSLWSFLAMRIRTSYADWPKWVDSNFGQLNSSRIASSDLEITHINHSTVLIQTAGFNILTDPIYSDRCSPVSWAGPKRVRNPGIRFEDLPPIDIVLISHDHYDHLDLPTLRRLIDRDKPLIYAGLGVQQQIGKDYPLQEMDWWESVEPQQGLKLHFVPVQHFSGRGLFDRNTTQWGGYVIEVGGRKIYFGGDTGYADHFKETRKKLGAMDVALIPVGAYEPHEFMGYAHVNPEEAVQAHLDLGSKFSIGIHYGTFQLTAEPLEEPPQNLQKALEKLKVNPAQFVTPDFGKTVRVPAAGTN